ncbi:MAG: hypothetical protein A2Z25_02365 [Planctomycetes bacterium RBG_16_55_9]|nr:MAG: hypothetical protein A2Z25_02365 [Planctomycetes bacterium RBG_16_55_9]
MENFRQFDVFAERKYEGNQLAVVRNAANLPDEQMLRITKEMNYSETTFILSDEPKDRGYDVRIFTPETEVPFAGHPTLGTAFVIRHLIAKQPVDTVKLNLKVGPIPVTFDKNEQGEDILWMQQIEPTFAKTATGSSNGCLAGYLIEHKYFGTSQMNIRVEQGYEIDRPSLLYLRAENGGEHIAVSVGGKVVKVAEGRLF